MSLLQRKARPLTRETSDFRDDRLFIVACDDTFAPEQYFDFFKLTRIKIHVVPTEDGTSHAQQVLDRLTKFKSDADEDDELWMLLDTDHCIKNTHIPAFKRAIKDAESKGINVALSRTCFEIWLLLHHVDESQVVELKNAAETEAALRRTLGEYNKTKLKSEHYSLSSVVQACQRAKRLDSQAGGAIPTQNTSRVYLLWYSIVAKALPSQLPHALQPLKENNIGVPE